VVALMFSLLRAQQPTAPMPPPVPTPAPEPAENQSLFGAHIQRSMTLLATSSKEPHWPVRVLLYGQSIVGSSLLTSMVETYLHERFPDAYITLENRGVVGDAPNSSLILRFDGNRVDAIAAHVKGISRTGTGRVLIDGKPPSTNPRVYTVTRPSRGPGTWFPAIRRIDYEKLPLVEDWTLRITAINKDATDIRFTVAGSKTGLDGSGSNKERFVSKSARVVIDPRDWMLSSIMTIFKQATAPPVGYEIHWSVRPLFVDTYKPPVADDPAKIYQTTLAQGMVNGPHTLEIISNGDGALPIEAIQVYHPPLR
jgi:hypothetical protein